MNTTATTNPPEGGNSVDQSNPLAQAETTEEINLRERGFENGGVTIRTRVTVQKCPRGFKSRLGYHAKLYIKIHNDVEREIGYITGWRISKPTRVNPNIDIVPSGDDWYWRDIRTYDDQSIHMANCYKALWDSAQPFARQGSMFSNPRVVSPQVIDEKKNQLDHATGNEIIYIQNIYIKWREDLSDEKTEYTGQGLGRLFLQHYYRVLGGRVLPAWYSLNGPVTYLLSPRPQWESQINECWDNLQKEKGYSDQKLHEEVAGTLSRVFQSEDYGYVPYAPNATVRGSRDPITVLGRVFDQADLDSLLKGHILISRLILPSAS